MNVFEKSPLKTVPKRKLNDWESGLMNEAFSSKPSDLAKLLFVLKNSITSEEWPPDEPGMRQLAADKVKLLFDDSGDAATEICFDMALEYGFIRIEADPNTGFKRYVESPKSQLDSSHDWFCFDCDIMIGKKNRQFLKCEKCLRVVHRKCSQEFDAIKDYKCRYCQRLEDCETNGFINERQRVDQKRINRLIGFLLDFVKSRMKKKFEEIDLKFSENEEFIYVFKKMNLSLMKEKVKKEEYRSLPEFDDDFFVYMHNLHITQIQFFDSEIGQNFTDLRTLMLKELTELKKCVDCYERANDKALHESNKEWFCLPCEPVHKPVFAKLKACPYWPAKIIQKSGDKKFEVCFFEAEKAKDKSKGNSPTFKKSEVKSSEIRAVDDFETLNSIKGNQRLVKPLELLLKYLIQLPQNQTYVKTIEFIKQIQSSPKVVISDTMDQSIESVVKSGRKPSKTSKQKPKLGQRENLSEPNSLLKSDKQKSRKKKSSKKINDLSNPPVLENMSNESNDSIDSLNNRVSDEIICEEPPELDLFNESTTESPNSTKRRSGRIAGRITPQKAEAKKSGLKSAKRFKRKEQKKSDEEMEVDVDDNYQTITPTIETVVESINNELQNENSVSQSSQSVLIVVNKSEQNIPINQTFGNKALDLSQSSVKASNSVSNVSQTKPLTANQNIENISDAMLNINLKTTSYSSSGSSTATITRPLSSTITTQSLTSESMASTSTASLAATVPLSVEIPSTSTSESIQSTTPSTSPLVEESVPKMVVIAPMVSSNENVFDSGLIDRINQRTEELIQMKEPISSLDLKEKIWVIDFYHKQMFQQMEAMKLEVKRLEEEMRDLKFKNWCSICQKEAKHFCCVRFYCSKECQIIDWKTGHYYQCLDNKKGLKK